MTGRVINDPWHPDWDGPKELLPLLAGRKLEQTCPRCGKTEPAGGRCSSCWIDPRWPYWHLNRQSGTKRQSFVREAITRALNRSQGISEQGRKHAAWCWLPSEHKGSCEGDQ